MLLDTHALIWWLSESRLLSRAARQAIANEENDVLVSAASIWEVAIKQRLGKLDAADAGIDLAAHVRDQGFTGLDITLPHAQRAGGLPLHHRDPFDRMLAAQALAENLALVSNEGMFDTYGVNRIW